MDSSLTVCHCTCFCCVCRFGGLLHDWPESYFKAQQARGTGLADVFQQAMGAARAQKITRQKSILARMFPGARLASMFGAQVGTQPRFRTAA